MKYYIFYVLNFNAILVSETGIKNHNTFPEVTLYGYTPIPKSRLDKHIVRVTIFIDSTNPAKIMYSIDKN